MRRTVTREDYFEASLALLASDSGDSTLKIAPLCKALRVTTGSFYGYFGNLDGFVTEFLAYWERSQTDRIVARTTEEPAARRVQLMKELVIHVPHEAEAAIRAWARSNSRVADAQRRVDERRVQALTDVLASALGSRAAAEQLALMGMTLFVGLQQVRSADLQRDFELLFGEFESVITSRTSAMP